MKICVIGYSGSGKSSFSIKLSRHYNLVATHIDKLHWDENWIERDKNIRDAMLKVVVSNDDWIIDGNYKNCVPIRFSEADKIFIFTFSRLKCLYGAIVRRIKYHNKTRESMTKGNTERLDFSFIMWILFKSRTKERKNFYKELKRKYPNNVIEFKKRSDVNAYLSSIGIKDFTIIS